jgi:hypothetical protein
LLTLAYERIVARLQAARDRSGLIQAQAGLAHEATATLHLEVRVGRAPH